MPEDVPTTVHFKLSRFSTSLPTRYLYTPSHFWIERRDDGVLRVGFTKFSTRMLGELVDHGFDVKDGDPVEPGKIIGWIEGFKAMSDLYCAATGEFAAANPILAEEIERVGKSPYTDGWLYEARGVPDERAMDVTAYAELLHGTISKMLEREQTEEQ
jgi:glycine cleavage system H protein